MPAGRPGPRAGVEVGCDDPQRQALFRRAGQQRPMHWQAAVEETPTKCPENEKPRLLAANGVFEGVEMQGFEPWSRQGN